MWPAFFTRPCPRHPHLRQRTWLGPYDRESFPHRSGTCESPPIPLAQSDAFGAGVAPSNRGGFDTSTRTEIHRQDSIHCSGALHCSEAAWRTGKRPRRPYARRASEAIAVCFNWHSLPEEATGLPNRSHTPVESRALPVHYAPEPFGDSCRSPMSRGLARPESPR